jgi:hypothetical protein
MKTTYRLTLLFILCFVSAELNAQQVWLNLYNGPSNGNDGSNAVTIDGAGNTYVTGYSTGIGSMRDITTLKYNSSGRLVWSRTYNGLSNNEDEAYAITIDNSGNIYVGGYTTDILSGRDIIVIKYNNNGVQQWVEKYNGPGFSSDEAYAITVDGLGNPIVTGYSFDLVLGAQMTLIKYNTSGNMQWLELYNAEIGSGADVAYAITVDAANDIYITGYSELTIGDSPSGKDMVTVKVSAAGVRKWVKKFDAENSDDEAYSIAVDDYDNVFITGYTSGENGKDYTTIKYDRNGNQKWKKTYNNQSANSDDIPSKLIIDEDGDVVVTGSSKSSNSAGKEDYLTIKYNNWDGRQEFATRYNDASNNSDKAYSLTAENGRYYVAGSSKSSSITGSEEIVVIEYDENGKLKTKYKVSNDGTDVARDIRVDDDKNITIAGSLNGAISDDMGAGRFFDDADGLGNEFVIVNVTNTYDMSTLTNLETTAPARFSLQQNYPNPFNPVTSIKFDVSSSSMVKVAIFDALGREVSVPVNDYLEAGSYDISVNMSGLTSGVYFYKMTSGSFSDIKKMMLIK